MVGWTLIGNGGVACSVGEVAALGIAYLHGDLQYGRVGLGSTIIERVGGILYEAGI